MQGAHVAARPRLRRPAARPSAARRLLGFAGGVVVAIALAVSAAGGTYAYLSSSATSASGATLKAGTADLAVTSTLALPTSRMYPGFTATGTATLRNTGTVPLDLQVQGLTPPTTATPFSAALTVGARVVPTAGDCTPATSPKWSGTFAAATAGSLASPVAPGASAVVCVTVTLPPAAPAAAAGQPAASFALLVNGRQIR